ncbi:hypothetical protein Tco_0489109 [Tanacetum coccineum]
MVCFMMSQTTRPKSFWDYALDIITQEASESLEDLEVIQDEDMHPIENTRLHDEEDVHKLLNLKEHELGDHNEPTNYKAALSYPESKKWLDAMNVEMQSMKDYQVWDLVDLPPNGNTVVSRWLFKKKTNMDGKTLELLGFLLQ